MRVGFGWILFVPRAFTNAPRALHCLLVRFMSPVDGLGMGGRYISVASRPMLEAFLPSYFQFDTVIQWLARKSTVLWENRLARSVLACFTFKWVSHCSPLSSTGHLPASFLDIPEVYELADGPLEKLAGRLWRRALR